LLLPFNQLLETQYTYKYEPLEQSVYASFQFDYHLTLLQLILQPTQQKLIFHLFSNQKKEKELIFHLLLLLLLLSGYQQAIYG
jgi:hypothetical protein